MINLLRLYAFINPKGFKKRYGYPPGFIIRDNGTSLKKPSLTETTIKHNPKCICRKCAIRRKK